MEINQSFQKSFLGTNHWFVVYTHTNAEKKVYERLQKKGFNSYLPLQKIRKQRTDRVVKLEVPLIRSVIFVEHSTQDIADLYTVPGITGVLKYLGKPAKVKPYEIENLRILLQEYEGYFMEENTEVFEQGDCVQVNKGQFKGLIGYSISHCGKHRVLINIESLGNQFIVNIPKSYIKKV